MSPVFRHGGLRLYLLKLLDEAPRHGYEVIRLLQDRFMGVYAPSPGTIYPRLARLEEEGLVTHDEVDGKKVYRITDKGRQEIESRLDDLAELEEQITASVRDIAREVTEDVRDTVRNLREELTWAAGQHRGQDREQAHEDPRERARRARDEVAESARRAREEARQGRGQRPGEQQDSEPARSGARDWADWASAQGWQAWAGWRGRSGPPPWGQREEQRGRGPGHGWPGHAGLDAALFRDLERLAVDFANQLRKAAWNTEGLRENALGDLRSILEDTLTKIRKDVFGGPGGGGSGGSSTAGAPSDGTTAPPSSGQPEAPDPRPGTGTDS
jgi:DNA-binding PadR family transcriptional regulator